MIECHNIYYEYPDGLEALSGVNLKIDEGKVKILLGRNGSGKTTLMQTIIGLLKPQCGEIFVDGQKVKYDRKSLVQLRKRVGYIFQNPDDQLVAPTVFQDLSFGLKNLGFEDQEIEERVRKVLDWLNLRGYEERLCSTLSGGEKKRVAIGDVLIMDPDYLLMDEPSSGLDGFGFEDLVKVIKRLKGLDKTILISTHDMELARAVGDNFAIIENGVIVQDGEISMEEVERFGIRSLNRW